MFYNLSFEVLLELFILSVDKVKQVKMTTLQAEWIFGKYL